MILQSHSCLGVNMKKTVIQNDTCTPIFISALFTIAKTQKQLKYPSIDEWIKKLRYVCALEYYSAIKKNEILPFVTICMDPESLILSEISQTERDKYHIIVLICGI